MGNEKDMNPKVIKLSAPKTGDPIVDTLKELLELAEKGVLDNFVFAGFDKFDRIIVAKPNTNVIEDQHLVSFLQSYATYRTASEMWLSEEDYYDGMYDDMDDDLFNDDESGDENDDDNDE